MLSWKNWWNKVWYVSREEKSTPHIFSECPILLGMWNKVCSWFGVSTIFGRQNLFYFVEICLDKMFEKNEGVVMKVVEHENK